MFEHGIARFSKLLGGMKLAVIGPAEVWQRDRFWKFVYCTFDRAISTWQWGEIRG